MKLTVTGIILLFSVTTTFGENCDKLGILLYEDLGCTPHYDGSKVCPTKYNCTTGLEPWKNKCYFRGKAYESGEHVDESLLVPPCDKGCFCSLAQEKAKFICAVLDCPEWLGRPLTPGCYRKYSLDNCCSTGEVCPPFDNIAKCSVDGKEYREGEKFSPAKTCLQCICLKGFQGKFEEPFCKKQTCNTQLRSSGENAQLGCAPFFKKQSSDEVLCCAYDWICPDGSEKIKGDGVAGDTCRFGDKTLKVGQRLEKSNFVNIFGRKLDSVECECIIPPLVTCIEVQK